MRRSLNLLAILCLSIAFVTPAMADGWMYRRSYYSHTPTSEVVIGRHSTASPVFSRPRGLYIQGGYRVLRSNITIRGQVWDSYNVYESWVQTGQQY